MSLEQPVLDALHTDNVEQAYELAVQQLEKVCLETSCSCWATLSFVKTSGFMCALRVGCSLAVKDALR
jgi:transcriptional accessory protein Tex/SPT6